MLCACTTLAFRVSAFPTADCVTRKQTLMGGSRGQFWKHGKLHVAKFLHWRLPLGQKSFLNCALLYGALSWPAEVSLFAAKTLNNTLTYRILKCSVSCLFGSNKLLMNRTRWLGYQKSGRLYCIFVCDFYILLRPSLDFCIVSVVLESPRVNTPPPLPPDGELLSHVLRQFTLFSLFLCKSISPFICQTS
jgi:hypothetical protein